MVIKYLKTKRSDIYKSTTTPTSIRKSITKPLKALESVKQPDRRKDFKVCLQRVLVTVQEEIVKHIKLKIAA